MELTKRLKVILIIITLLSSPFIFYKLQGPRIYWINTYGGRVGDHELDVFVIQNPPSSKEDLLNVIKKMNDTLDFKYKEGNNDCYTQKFYKETFNLTRYHKPYYTSFIKHYVNIYTDDSDFDEKIVHYNSKEMNEDYNCSGDPSYQFYLKNNMSWKYYPKGLKNNPNKHWDIR